MHQANWVDVAAASMKPNMQQPATIMLLLAHAQ
jgi:hypothetical protein